MNKNELIRRLAIALIEQQRPPISSPLSDEDLDLLVSVQRHPAVQQALDDGGDGAREELEDAE
jgi:hypothetical protein